MTKEARRMAEVVAEYQAEIERIKKAVEAATNNAVEKLQIIISEMELKALRRPTPTHK